MSDSQMLRCPACGTTNRVPLAKIEQGLQPRCGSCKAPLLLGSKPLVVTDANFSAEVQSSTLPVLLDFWAPWCGPCRSIAPVIDQLAMEMAGRVKVGKLNVDDNPVTASRFDVRSIPALLVLQGGREVDRIVGAQPKSEIERRLQRVLTRA